MQDDVRVVKLGRNRGYAGGVSAGLAAANGDYLLQLNTDLVLDREAIRRLLNAIDHTRRRELTSCRFRMADGRPQPYSYQAPTLLHLPAHLLGARSLATRMRLLAAISPQLHDYLDEPTTTTVREVAVLSGACMLYAREVIENIGPPDSEIFFGPDDWDFCARARAAGYRLGLVDAPLLTHAGGATSVREHGRPYHWIFYKGWVYYHRKHDGRIGSALLGVLVLAVVPFQILRAVLGISDPQRPADVGLLLRIVVECLKQSVRSSPSHH
jgi:hypothetical protein